MGRRKKGDVVDGWVCLDKPFELGSTEAVSRIRRLFNAQKAGHAGTLDPLASGILPIALGEATKTVPFMMEAQKVYRFTINWGVSTDSVDREGEIIGRSDVRPTVDQVKAALPAFVGEIDQTPPRFSAIKVDGARAYDLARDEVVLIEQIRIPAFDTSETPWLLELVAGMIEEGESVEDVARREAVEEAGLQVGRVKEFMSYLASPGGTSERLSLMVGEVDATQAKGIHGLVDENEDIRVHVVSREQAYQWVEEGKIDNAASVIALQWLQLHYQTLRNEWKK